MNSRFSRPERENVMQHRVHQRDVGARQRLQMNVRTRRELDASRIAHDQRRAALDGALDRRTEHRDATPSCWRRAGR